jgi:hypothetical protein
MVAPTVLCVRVSWFMAIASLASGCFYTDTINQRPSLDIRTPSQSPFRGDQDVRFEAVFDDPEGHGIFPEWNIKACDDGNRPETCDQQAFATGTNPTIEVDVPRFRADGTPVRSLRVVLEAEDEYGARAKPPQLAVVPVRDAPPDLVIALERPYDGVVETPVDLIIEYGDADDTAAGVTLEIDVTAPGLADETLIDLDVPQPDDPDRRRIGRRLVPAIKGEWRIDLVATSAGGEVVTVTRTVAIIDDRPPCLAELSPAVPPPSSALLPLSEPTLFQVLAVTDALDRFPTIIGDPFLGPTRFAWSLKVNAGPRQPLASTGNAVELAPQSFTPGDQVELRVEVFDRNAAPITCGDADPSCTIVADPACLQRQTWLVEVR